MKKPKWRMFLDKNKVFQWKLNYYINRELQWKDKFGTPRVELGPTYIFNWSYWNIAFIQGNDSDWEWYVWVTKYNKGDIEMAKKSYGWSTKLPDGTYVKSKPWEIYNK
jgi:hypothetical protein